MPHKRLGQDAAARHDRQRLAYSPQEAADALGVHRSTIYERLNDGTLRSVHVGSRRLIPASELRRLLGEVEATA